MKYIVLGHTGFVGKNLTKFLLDKGHEVFGLSRRECDLRNYEQFSHCLEKIGHVDMMQHDHTPRSCVRLTSCTTPHKITARLHSWCRGWQQTCS